MKSSHHFNKADFLPVMKIALEFPGTEESVSHENTPSVKVGRKLMCRLHDSGEFIPIHLDFEKRAEYLEAYPEIFHVPDHFRAYPYICMWIHSYNVKMLREILEWSWRGLATKKQIQQWDAQKK